MPSTPLARVLARLLPLAVRRELFEPAFLDLYGNAARTGGRITIPTLLLFLECWRLAPAEVITMLLHDIRHGLRLLIREPGFTTAAVLTLALGIGANAAVFAVVNAALLRPLPYPDADRLVLLEHRDRRTGIAKQFVAMGDLVDLRTRQHAFESIAAYGAGPQTIFDVGEPFDVLVLHASPDLLDILRVRPALGRAFTADDGKPGAAPVMMLSHEVWQQRFAGDPAIVGRAIHLGQTTTQVIGIAPRGFRFPANHRTGAIVPAAIPAETPAVRKSGWWFAAARLKPGATREQAQADVTAIARQMEAEFPADNQGSEYAVRSLREMMIGDTRPALLLLLAAVAAVLLIACVNVANLLVARAVGRRQEMAVRVALGAGRGRLVVQSLAENLVLAIVAGSVGILIARAATPALVTLVPASVNLPGLTDVRVDGAVLAFTAAITLLTTFVFGAISAFGIHLDHAGAALVNPGRVTASISARRASSALVIVETAVAIVLLTGAGLVLRSFAHLLSVDPGFSTDRVMTMDVVLPAARYEDAAARAAFYSRAFDNLQRVNGIESVGAAAIVPLTGNNWTVPFDRADKPVPAGQRAPDVGWQAATAGYFRTLRIPLREGRLFGPADRPGGPTVVIISEAIRDRFFPGESPIGRRILGPDGGAEIVGVVGNIRRAALTDSPRADLYFPGEQGPQLGTSLFIRTTGNSQSSIADVRSTLRAMEPLIVIRDIQTMDNVARESVQVTSLALWLLGLFAAIALALASVGIYGVMAYAVRQRTREIGTRLALGATPSSILWLVMRDGLSVAGIGAAIGLLVGLGVSRQMKPLLFATAPGDPATLLAATLALMTVALTACYIPARRATRTNPRESLIPNP
jgi:putative ABC transport system permease protein